LLSASGSARIEAARKLTALVRQEHERGMASNRDVLAQAELEFRAVRDSGIVGPELVAAATTYAAAARDALATAKQQFQGGAAGRTDVARMEYAIAEAAYWLEEAKNSR
jgi:outer membrane protein TolC